MSMAIGNVKPMSQFGPKQTMQQGYSNTVTGAVPAYQQMLQMQKQNPGLGSYIQGLTARPVEGWQQYQQLQRQAQPVTQFAGYASRQGMGDPRQIMQQIGQQGIGNYAPAVQDYGGWMDREVKRANASGMLAGGLGALIPGLALGALPLSGMAAAAAGGMFGGMRGGPLGAVRGAAPGPMGMVNRLRG